MQQSGWNHADAAAAATPIETMSANDRILHIDRMFERHGAAVAADWRRQLGQGGYSEDFEVARYEINRCLRMLLVGASDNTFATRYSIVDDGSEREWLALLEMQVVKDICRYGLVEQRAKTEA